MRPTSVTASASLLLVLLLSLCCASDAQSDSYPKPIGLVNDYSGVLNNNQLAELSNVVGQYEKDTSIEIAVVIMDSISPSTNIDTYATALFNCWGIGKREKNNGLLFLVALKDRKVRLEVGLGLENIITDELAGQILDTTVIPRFKEGQHYQGILDGVRSAIDILDNKRSVQQAD